MQNIIFNQIKIFIHISYSSKLIQITMFLSALFRNTIPFFLSGSVDHNALNEKETTYVCSMSAKEY